MTPWPLTDPMFVEGGELYVVGPLRCYSCMHRWFHTRVAGTDPAELPCPACKRYGVDHCEGDPAVATVH